MVERVVRQMSKGVEDDKVVVCDCGSGVARDGE